MKGILALGESSSSDGGQLLVGRERKEKKKQCKSVSGTREKERRARTLRVRGEKERARHRRQRAMEIEKGKGREGQERWKGRPPRDDDGEVKGRTEGTARGNKEKLGRKKTLAGKERRER